MNKQETFKIFQATVSSKKLIFLVEFFSYFYIIYPLYQFFIRMSSSNNQQFNPNYIRHTLIESLINPSKAHTPLCIPPPDDLALPDTLHNTVLNFKQLCIFYPHHNLVPDMNQAGLSADLQQEIVQFQLQQQKLQEQHYIDLQATCTLHPCLSSGIINVLPTNDKYICSNDGANQLRVASDYTSIFQSPPKRSYHEVVTCSQFQSNKRVKNTSQQLVIH